MTRARIVLATGLIVGLVAALMPTSAAAEQRHGHRARVAPHGSWQHARDGGHRPQFGDHGQFGQRGHFGHHAQFRHHGQFGHHGHHGHHWPRSFVTFYSAPPVVYYPYYTPPPVYYAPPVVYQAPQAYVQAPPAVPRVVEYPTGRYELRGDGVTTPYTWVWIPNPPAAPPAPIEPSALPRESTAITVVPTASREAFRWTDDHGVTTWTDRLDSVPERYRGHVQRFR